MKKIIDFLIREWGIEGNTAATIVVTIVTFILGILATLLSNYILNYLKRRSYKIGLKLIIRDFVKSCKKQYETILNKSINQDLFNGGETTIHLVSNHGLNYLSNLDKKEFVSSFYSLWMPRKSKVYSRLFEIVETVLLTNRLYIETTKEIMTLFSKQESLFQEGLVGLRKQNDEFLELLQNKKIENEIDLSFAKKYCSVFMNFVNDNVDTRIINTNSRIVQPLLELVRNSHPTLYTQKVTDFCLLSNISYINIEKLNTVLIQKMRDTLIEYKRASKLGEIILKKL